MHVVDSGRPGGKDARLAYRQIVGDGRLSLLEIELETGRKHQIRLQLAHHGQPIVGDRKYGSAVKFPAGIALHARRLVIAHPVRGESLEFLRRCPSTGRGRFSRSGVSPLRKCGETPHLLSPARIA